MALSTMPATKAKPRASGVWMPKELSESGPATAPMIPVRMVNVAVTAGAPVDAEA